MKKLFLASGIAALLVFSNCGPSRKVERIDPNTVTDISGRWNDTDSKLVAEEMIKDVLDRPWRTNFEMKNSKRPTVIVGQIRNKTTEHIDAGLFIKNIEKAFINSGTVSVVQSGEERNEVRDERSDQQTFSSEETRKKWGKEKGADFMLNGVMMSVTDQYKNQKTVKYQINLELTDLETNEKVWIGEKEIKKFIKN
ncbi:MAG: penicillin-binding protein activator LpoB [Bacteroidia bacterium]|nr:penicillin-binding protein activator LpoB [Bacteroidia bacterium]MCF8426054.1 penicillin-binding protein activator LpoB [Bacteroidia bacterium]MCF8445351.1 penicillin-binding protein activator LpoB [Bacteroidia bacterium]